MPMPRYKTKLIRMVRLIRTKREILSWPLLPVPTPNPSPNIPSLPPARNIDMFASKNKCYTQLVDVAVVFSPLMTASPCSVEAYSNHLTPIWIFHPPCSPMLTLVMAPFLWTDQERPRCKAYGKHLLLLPLEQRAPNNDLTTISGIHSPHFVFLGLLRFPLCSAGVRGCEKCAYPALFVICLFFLSWP